MDLRTSYPFWLLDQGIIRSNPSLARKGIGIALQWLDKALPIKARALQSAF